MPADLDNIFTYPKPFGEPFGDQPERYVAIREKAKEFAKLIIEMTPASTEQTIAIRDLQRCVMMANAAIAIHEKESLPTTDFED